MAALANLHVPAFVLPAVMLALGAIICFAGYRVLRVSLVLAGFVAGLLLGTLVTSAIPGAGRGFIMLASTVAGLAGALLSLVLYRVGVFLLGVLAGLAATDFVIAMLAVKLAWPLWLLAALAGGVLTLVLERLLLTLLTAASGAWLVVAAAGGLAGRYPLEFTPGRVPLPEPAAGPGWVKPVMLFGWILLTVLGLAAQRGRRKKD